MINYGGISMRKTMFNYLIMVIGSIVYSLGVAAFLMPANIGVGGVTGIALSLNKLLGLKVGFVIIVLNIPLFVSGYKLIGFKFSFRSAFVVFVYSVIIDLLNLMYNFPPLEDKLLATIFSGTLSGIGAALVFMGGGSTGGLDILAKIIINKFTNLNISNVLLIQDIIVFIFVAYAMGFDAVMYALVMSFIRTKVLDTIQEGVSSSKQCIIICERAQELSNEIQSKLARGVTILNAQGGFSHKNKSFIYVVIQKNQLNHLRTIVKSIEPSAFVTVSSVNDIVGNYRQSVTI
jgi:uncharacterized membrane-anchored protein YitT (DUF2179 family)